MSYQVSWILNKRILHIVFEGEITLDDIQQATTKTADFLDEAYQDPDAPSVIGVVNMLDTNLSQIFRSVLSVVANRVKDVIDVRIGQARSGFMILVTGSERAQSLISLILKLYSRPMTTVSSVDEALTVISAMYPELEAEIQMYREQHHTRSGT